MKFSLGSIFVGVFILIVCRVDAKYFFEDVPRPPTQRFEPEKFYNWPPVRERTNQDFISLTTSLLHDIYSRGGKNFNIVISPASIWTILAMLLEGAGGRTEKELKTKLQLPLNPPDEGKKIVRNLFKKWKNYLQELSAPNRQTEFVSLNCIIGDKTKMTNPEYRHIINHFYNGLSFQVDPKNRNLFSVMINDWVKQVSGNRIDSIISPDMLDNLIMIVVNAVYFKSNWKYPFDPARTTPSPFKDENSTFIKNVPMMNQILILPYSESLELQSQIVEIPYSDGLTSMVVILPQHGISLISVLSKLRYLSLKKIVLRDMDVESVQLSLPKFHVISKMSLNGILKQDLRSMFDRQTAEFPFIAKDIFVNKITHRAEIENSEKGTTASAITSVQFAYKSSGVVFRADRPFIYFIIDKKTKNVFFAGTYSNPLTG